MVRCDLSAFIWASGEMVYALVLGTSAARHVGSTPTSPTNPKTGLESLDF